MSRSTRASYGSPLQQESFALLNSRFFPSPNGRGLKERDLIQRAFFGARFKILLLLRKPTEVMQRSQKGEANGARGERLQLRTILKRSLLIGRFRFEIRHIALRHGKPQDDLPADFVLRACQSDVAQLNYV